MDPFEVVHSTLNVHPLDRQRVGELAEALCDISAGRRLTLAGLEHQVGMLLINTLSPCSSAGASAVLRRMLARTGDRCGVLDMEDVVFDELITEGVRRGSLLPSATWPPAADDEPRPRADDPALRGGLP